MTKKKNIKNKKTVKKVSVENDNEILKLIKLVIILTLIFVAFYVLTMFINKEEEDTPVADTPASIQYDKILAGNILKQSPKSYYVLAYDTEDYDYTVYDAYATRYENSLLGTPVYKVELNNPFNLAFVGEKSNFKFKDIKDLRFSGAALLKIEKNKITESFEGEKMLAELERLANIVKVEKD